jgi:hypothetical protein
MAVTEAPRKGNSVGDGFAAVAKVDAGTAADWHATGTFNAKGPLKCKLSSVTRNLVAVARSTPPPLSIKVSTCLDLGSTP